MRTAEAVTEAIKCAYGADSTNSTPACYLIAEMLLDIRDHLDEISRHLGNISADTETMRPAPIDEPEITLDGDPVP